MEKLRLKLSAVSTYTVKNSCNDSENKEKERFKNDFKTTPRIKS